MKEILERFYDENKNNKFILSRQEIVEYSKKFITMSQYKHGYYKPYIDKIIFGFKNGMSFTEDKVLTSEGELRVYTYSDLNTLRVSEEWAYEYFISGDKHSAILQGAGGGAQLVELVMLFKKFLGVNGIITIQEKEDITTDYYEKFKNEVIVADKDEDFEFLTINDVIEVGKELLKEYAHFLGKDYIDLQLTKPDNINQLNLKVPNYIKYFEKQITSDNQIPLFYIKDRIILTDKKLYAWSYLNKKLIEVKYSCINELEIRRRGSKDYECNLIVNDNVVSLYDDRLSDEKKLIELFINKINPIIIERGIAHGEHTYQIEKKEVDKKIENVRDIIIVTEVDSFGKLLNKLESEITSKDSEYILKFVRLSSFLNFKRNTVLDLLNRLEDVDNINDFESLDQMLNKQNDVLNQVLAYSLSLLTALIENKMIVFYSIYEKFDKLGVFNSQWENDLKNSLNDVNNNLAVVIQGINSLEDTIWTELSSLNDSVQSLEHNVISSLDGIETNLSYSNLLSTINTYQNYKIKKKLN
jgi:hypothetical protein